MVAKYMNRKNIHTRQALATWLDRPKTAVYRSFNPDWSGEATVELLALLSATLDVPIERLICDPRSHCLVKELKCCS